MSLMELAEVRTFWEANADAWVRLSRAGYDVYRDHVNTPAFFRMLPDVHDKVGIDIGCGEGHNTRLVAHRGARLSAVDIAPTFLRAAIEVERVEPRGIRYRFGDAEALPFHDRSFDFATAFMSLMDVAHPERAIAEAARILRPGGFLQFSITHPCFQRRRSEATGRTELVGDYFGAVDGEVDTWTFGAAPADVRAQERPFQIPMFSRTLSEWLNALASAGLAIERVDEPRASEEAVAAHPNLANARAMPLFLLILARKPSS